MKVRPFTLLTLAFTLTLPSGAFAQNNGNTRSIPAEADLRRMGKVATLAEAAPLLKELDEAKEAHFQARRAARLQMQGKSETERLDIWTGMLSAERKRRERIRELEFKTDAVRKQDWENKRSGAKKEGGA